MKPALPFKITVLLFIRDSRNRHLLIERRKAPNAGRWSPIGGKLESATGESPFEAAVREAREETGIELQTGDLHLFCMIAEKGYEGTGHWLMFLFDCRKPIGQLPPAISEGQFGFFERNEIDTLPLPETDRQMLWRIYDEHRTGFVALRANCHPDGPLEFTIEQQM